MNKAILGVGISLVFSIGLFTGGKVVNSDESIYALFHIGNYGTFGIGKKLDPNEPDKWGRNDKFGLIAGIKDLPSNDYLSTSIREMAKKGESIFGPEEFNIKVHVISDQKLNNHKASICKSNRIDFYKKIITIFDNRPESKIKRIVQVSAWDISDNVLCMDSESHHIWVHLDTANRLFPDDSTAVTVGSELDLLGRVPNSSIDPLEVS